MDGALLRNFKQLRALIGSERAGEFNFTLNAVENPLFRLARLAVFRVNFRMPKANDNALERPILALRVHAYGH